MSFIRAALEFDVSLNKWVPNKMKVSKKSFCLGGGKGSYFDRFHCKNSSIKPTAYSKNVQYVYVQRHVIVN